MRVTGPARAKRDETIPMERSLPYIDVQRQTTITTELPVTVTTTTSSTTTVFYSSPSRRTRANLKAMEGRGESTRLRPLCTASPSSTDVALRVTHLARANRNKPISTERSLPYIGCWRQTIITTDPFKSRQRPVERLLHRPTSRPRWEAGSRGPPGLGHYVLYLPQGRALSYG